MVACQRHPLLRLGLSILMEYIRSSCTHTTKKEKQMKGKSSKYTKCNRAHFHPLQEQESWSWRMQEICSEAILLHTKLFVFGNSKIEYREASATINISLSLSHSVCVSVCVSKRKNSLDGKLQVIKDIRENQVWRMLVQSWTYKIQKYVFFSL